MSAGSTLTLHGVGLLPAGTLPGVLVDSVEVWLASAPCLNVLAVNSSQTEDIISCTVPNYESDYHHVDIHVQGKGFASVHPTPLHPGVPRNATITAGNASPYPHVFLGVVVSSISPNSGSVLGGSEVIINGSGFSVSVSRVFVGIGQVPCVVTASTLSVIRCTTGPSPSPARDLMLDLGVVINGHPALSVSTFTYSLASTPRVLGLSARHATAGENITISGSGFSESSHVRIVSTSSEFVGEGDECQVIASSETEIRCTLPVKPAGVYQVLVTVEGLGHAQATPPGAATVEYALTVDDFSPTSGGYGGGVVLTISGAGFPQEEEDRTGLTVTVCDIPCSVIASTLSILTCVLAPSTAQHTRDSTTCGLTVDFNAMLATASENYTLSGALTPTLSSVSPTMGGTTGGTTVILAGSGFFPPGVASFNLLTPGDITVSIDGATCEWANLTVTDTEIRCRTNSHRTTLQARVEVTVQGKGQAVNEGTPVIFEYVDLWSSMFTWGGEALPGRGESVYIRTGQTVFLDTSPPELNLLLIEGALIFSDTQDLHLQAKYIFVNNGTLQVCNGLLLVD